MYAADADCPHSPNALAAAVTLATLSDSRPPTSHGDYEEDVDADDDADDHDDDYSGGISLADYQQFVQATPSMHNMEEEESVAAQMQTFIAQIQSSYAAYPTFAHSAIPGFYEPPLKFRSQPGATANAARSASEHP
jgi:hypothetical protein